jgi:ABC-2 type transport system ATP-binding protein
MTALVEVRNLQKRFGPIAAVAGVSFDVARGEVLGFLGPNGAGKSTTMRMIGGYLKPDRGTIRVGGEDVVRTPLAAKRRIGYLPEGAPLYGEMTPAHLLAFVGAVRGLAGAEKKRRITEVAEKVRIESVMHQPIETLSKGYKRRVGLAQAILSQPEVLILDEPTDGLDPNQKHAVRELIRELATRTAIVISTHILEEVDAICTRACVIARGRVVADGTPDELAARSALHRSIVVELRGRTAVGVSNDLSRTSAIRMVESLSASEGLLRLRIHAPDVEVAKAELGAAVTRHSCEIYELNVERGRLDDVFRTITASAS